ncbi:hypothetical protein CerSpe_159970 [Prunus speciosa]
MGSKFVQFVCLVLLLVSIVKVGAQQAVFDVMNHGGVADGKTDNSKVFTDVWNQACQNNGGGVVLFSTGTYFVEPVVLYGGCKGPIGVQIEGTLLAPEELESSVNIDH